jgi:ethanolamine ammonia-lyase small subunit
MSDPWQQLRRLTTARIALGRTGGSLPTRELLDFRLAHARARDAVLAPFDAAGLADRLRALGTDVICLESAATTQTDFLRRPDLGRRLANSSRDRLAARTAAEALVSCDLAIIVSDGLSSLAATEHAPPLLAAMLPLVRRSGWTLAPLIVVTHGRVALQDEIGALLHARLTLMLLGERPGLGAVDSLGAYFTYAPHPGLTDAARNCVSNIRTEGLSPLEAAHKLHNLITQSLSRSLSGVELKDDAPALPTPPIREAAISGPRSECLPPGTHLRSLDQ